MQVLKFGGSSVANAENISKVTEIVAKATEKDRTILVCSAISGCTDKLIEIGRLASQRSKSYPNLINALKEQHHSIILNLLSQEKQEEALFQCNRTFESLLSIVQGVYLLGELSPASLDAIQGCGEILSTKIISLHLASIGIANKWIDSRSIIETSSSEAGAQVNFSKTYNNIEKMVSDHPQTSLFVMPGFIASDSTDPQTKCGRTTTLGRGGSDYTASILAVGCKARLLEIWTDVPGMMTSNPKIVPTARTIGNISYRAALELSHFGAKVIYPPTIQPVVSEGIPIYIKNTFEPSAHGTLIEKNPPRSQNSLIGISNSDNIALLSLEGSGMVGIPGFSSRLFEQLSRDGINIILITQASSVHTMCIAVAEKDAEKAKKGADECFAYEISLGKLNPLKIEKGFSIVCLVGDDMLNHSGATGRMLAALGRKNIPVRATAQGSSERNISVIVQSRMVKEAIVSIHNEFFDKSPEKQINLFIAGFGTIGKALVDIIDNNADKIAKRCGKRVVICAVANSRKYIINNCGIDASQVGHLLENGASASENAFHEALLGCTAENPIFVDCTASSDIAHKYISLLKKGYSIVACNKILFSAPIQEYKSVCKTALENGTSIKYETTVGAALPILESIARGVNSGDDIIKMEAVLSGTLNYIFSTYKGGEDGLTFSQVVRKAQESGYTEPDPRLDLSGKDVLRKLLISARTAGLELEESDVETEPILGKEYFEGSIEEFYSLLEKNENLFASRYHQAAQNGYKQRFVASLTKRADAVSSTEDKKSSITKGCYKATISLCNVASDHPLYNLEGSDNCAIITTRFYPSPLVIQGAGAGAYQTASGVLNDILSSVE